MHGLDLNAVRSTAPLSLGRVLYGVIGLAVVGFLAGLVFAWTYNAVNRKWLGVGVGSPLLFQSAQYRLHFDAGSHVAGMIFH
jgi:2TM family of unknown function (DUF5676)